MDIDAFVVRRAAQWNRLDRLARRRRLNTAEVDELLELHQATATDLSTLRTALPDAELIGRLSGTLALSRAALTAPRVAGWGVIAAFFTRKLPAALYRSRWWWGTTAILSLLGALILGWWLVAHPEVRGQLLPSQAVQQLTQPGGEFETYYRSAPARDFAALVWTHNFFLALETLFSGVLLGIPVVFFLWQNVENLAGDGAYMVAAGRGNEFFTLILPHGMLELTSIFVSAGVGLRLGWTLVAPGPRTRLAALEQEGRIAAVTGIGLIITLLCSGLIEAFVTPSTLPPWARIGVGALAEAAFLAYVFILGRRVYRTGEAGDVAAEDRAAELPAVG
jgi:uncharacterized membrane protein SpoIIM required for sporulation